MKPTQTPEEAALGVPIRNPSPKPKRASKKAPKKTTKKAPRKR